MRKGVQYGTNPNKRGGRAHVHPAVTEIFCNIYYKLLSRYNIQLLLQLGHRSIAWCATTWTW